MSDYIPRTALARELEEQNKRRQHGLKTGEYVYYPDATAKYKFTVKANKLEGPRAERLKADMDKQLKFIAEYEAKVAGSKTLQDGNAK